METKNLKINIKQAADQKFELVLPQTSKISDVKEECAKQVNGKASEIKLIYKGFIFFS